MRTDAPFWEVNLSANGSINKSFDPNDRSWSLPDDPPVFSSPESAVD